MPPDLKLIESFVHIMRAGSLTGAEKRTGQSKATLSRQLQKLEQELGTQLLTRTTRHVIPTEAGRAFFVHCESLLGELTGRLERARHEIQQLGSADSGTLSILCDSEFSTTFVCHVTRKFLELFPNVVCHLNVAGLERSPGVTEVDCYVCATPPELPNLIGKPLGRLSRGLYASPYYLRKHGAPLSPADLAGHGAIALNEADGFKSVVLHARQGSHTWSPRHVISTNDAWVMKTFCVDGFGLALLPDYFAQPEVGQKLLVSVLPEWRPVNKSIYCAYQKQRYPGQKLEAFLRLMIDCVDQIDTLSRYVAFPGA